MSVVDRHGEKLILQRQPGLLDLLRRRYVAGDEMKLRRVAMLQLHADGFSFREIGTVCGCTEGNVRWHVNAAKADLRGMLAADAA